jgi:6-pyruvoyltetrahydropterin/6-carboxytetrahydropterin synthase
MSSRADTTLPSNRVPQPASAQRLYRSTKTYDHNEGLSCCFRQWRSDSHCRLIHGYALAFRFVFATHTLDERNWCLDFGGLKAVRAWLHEVFDHTVLITFDDPYRHEFERLAELGLMDLRMLPAVSCEAVAQHAFEHVGKIVSADTNGRVWVESVEVSEHGGNSAMYREDFPESGPAH